MKINPHTELDMVIIAILVVVIASGLLQELWLTWRSWREARKVARENLGDLS